MGPLEAYDHESAHAALIAAHTAYWETLHALMEARAAATGAARHEAPVPEEGYFEYDESWFDDDGSDDGR